MWKIWFLLKVVVFSVVDFLKISGSGASLIGDANAFTCVPGANLDFKYQWG
jgi:hypothetical protein